MNALSLQNYGGGGGFNGLQKSYVPLNAEKCIQNVKKIKIIFRCFINPGGKECIHY